MKLCLVVGNFPELSESFIIRLIEGLIAKGISISLHVTGSYREDKLHEHSSLSEAMIAGRLKIISSDSNLLAYAISLAFGLKYLPIAVKSGVRIKTILKSLRFIMELRGHGERYDVVHAQFLNLALPLAFAREVRALPNSTALLSTIRGFDITNKAAVCDKEVKLIQKNIDLLLPVSNSLAQSATARGLNKKKIHVVYSGLDVQKVQYRNPSELSDRPVSFIQVGRLVGKKGVDMSVRLIATLKKKGIKCHLKIIGYGPDEENLRTMVKDLNVEDSIMFVGPLPNKAVLEHISASDFLLAPSRTAKNGDKEGIPNVVKEAMAIGCIVIASDHSGVPELILDGETGYLFRENSPEEYTEAAMRALNNSNEIIAINARARVLKYFDTAVVVGTLVDIYRALPVIISKGV